MTRIRMAAPRALTRLAFGARVRLAPRALVLVAALALAVTASAQPPGFSLEDIGPDEATALFREANELFAEGSYGSAAAIYENVIARGFRNAELHYNLANARYKTGEIGRAVLGYERALKLDPTHEDAAANLEFMREQLADRSVPVGGAVSTAVDRFFKRAPSGGLTVATSLVYFLLVGCVIAGVLRRVFRPWLLRTVVVLVSLLVVAGAVLGFKLYRAGTVREAIVVSVEVPVRTGPGDDFVLEFRLHEGTKVRMRETRDEWSRVSVEGTDLEGWLPAGTVEEI